MRKILVLFIAILLFSGCIGQKNIDQKAVKTVKNGDNISVDYVGRIEGGKIFDTSIESVSKQNDIYNKGRNYQPLNFTVGKGQVIKGFDEGVLGMKVGDTKTLTIPPEEGYGPIDQSKISIFPIVMSLPVMANISRNLDMPVEQFRTVFSQNPSVGNNVRVPNSNVNLTIKSVDKNISLTYNLAVGDEIYQKGAPWNETVVSIDDKNIKVRADVKKNDVVQLQNAFWNSTVTDINDTNVTLRHNAIPDKEIPSLYGNMIVHFNETAITFDQNNKLAGKTLIFEVSIKSIE